MRDCDVYVDLGCGFTATLLRWVVSEFQIKKAIGLDLSCNPALSTEKISFQEGDLNNEIALPDNSADLITSLAVLEHLSNARKNLQEVYRILKPGGRLVMTTPTPLSKPVLEFLSFKLGLINKDEVMDHKDYYNTVRLREMLSSAGFAPENIQASVFLCGLNNFVLAIK